MNKLEALKCVEVTSQRQADNGTISYYDPETRMFYNLYESGYVRRSTGRFRMSNGKLSREAIYQLNPTKLERGVATFSDGYGYVFTSKTRIMLETHEERMNCAARAVINYRKTSKAYFEGLYSKN